MQIFKQNFLATPVNRPNTEKYVSIIDSKIMPCDSVKQLKNAQNVFANYAKEKDIRLKIFDPRHRTNLQKLVPNSNLEACVGVEITKEHKAGKSTQFVIVDYFKDMKKPLVQRVYDGIRNVIEGDTRQPIEKETAKTIEKLIKAGKIKV